MITWTNHDRTALNAWLNEDLGQKFIRYLEQSRPRYDDELELNKLALAGAVAKGYEAALDMIDLMRQVQAPVLPNIKYVETKTD